jgi:hypothetical protein
MDKVKNGEGESKDEANEDSESEISGQATETTGDTANFGFELKVTKEDEMVRKVDKLIDDATKEDEEEVLREMDSEQESTAIEEALENVAEELNIQNKQYEDALKGSTLKDKITAMLPEKLVNSLSFLARLLAKFHEIVAGHISHLKQRYHGLNQVEKSS